MALGYHTALMDRMRSLEKSLKDEGQVNKDSILEKVAWAHEEDIKSVTKVLDGMAACQEEMKEAMVQGTKVQANQCSLSIKQHSLTKKMVKVIDQSLKTLNVLLNHVEDEM